MSASFVAKLSDDELFSELKRLASLERESTVEVLRHLAELDRRRAVEQTHTPSLFVYCVRELGYSEGAAYRRIHAARCARSFPRAFVLLKRGRISLTTVSTLAPHLTRENHRRLLEQACGMTKYEVGRLVAGFQPRPEGRELIRALSPSPKACSQSPQSDALPLSDASPPTGSTEPPPVDPAEAAAGARRVEFRFYADEDFLGKFRRAREVLWHKHPRGRLEDILGEAIEALLDKRDPERRIARKRKRRTASPPGVFPGSSGPAF